MISFDSSEISNWADKPDANHQLPESVRRLILATIPRTARIVMPSGSSVRMPGWDGLLEVPEGNTWVPKGKSAWEFTCDKESKRKADDDYDKRTKDPLGVDPTQTTLVLVTSRRWPGKSEWETARQNEACWSNVRFLDAVNLVEWLEQAPAVSGWFAKLIGKLPDTGVMPLGEWWEHWASATQPRVTPGLVLAGRGDQINTLQLWAKGEASSWYVQADSQREAIAYLAAGANHAASTWGPTLLSRALVVQTEDAWMSLEHHPYPLVLIRGFTGTVSSQIAIKNGHHVFVPLDTSQEPRGKGQTLSRLDRDKMVESLIAMGLPEANAGSLARRSARRLSILYRFLIDEAGAPGPDWATTAPNTVIALVLLGQWEENHSGDLDIIKRLTGKSVDEIELDVTAVAGIPDPPISKVGDIWKFTSHEEAWHILAPRLTSSMVARFKDLAIEVMCQLSPALDLPINERYLATVKGKGLPHSETLRQGISRTLALMGVYYHRVKFTDSAASLPYQVVSNSLSEGKGWQIWATLNSELATLAEAAPDALLSALERDLWTDPSPLKDLFLQEGTPPFGGAPHTGLLWALERLAWSADHFSRVATILSCLSELDPGGNLTNRPSESLRGMFLPWRKFSETSDDTRLETLEALLSRYHQAGWQLIVSVHPSGYSMVMERQPPNWRPWGQDASLTPTNQECWDFADAVEKLLVSFVHKNVARWPDFVEIVSDLSPEVCRDALDSLLRQIEEFKDQLLGSEIWGKVRFQLHRHRLHPDANWAMTVEEVTTLARIYEELTPSNAISANSWLFDGWPDLPNPTGQEPGIQDSMDTREQLNAARQEAVRAVYEAGGTESVLQLVEAAANPSDVGVAVALTMGADLLISLASPHIGSTSEKLRQFAHGITSVLSRTANWEPLERILEQVRVAGGDPDRIAAVYLCRSANLETWSRLALEAQEIQDAYWRQLPAFQLPRQDPEGMAIGVQRFLSAHRSTELLRILWPDEVDVEQIVPVLEQVPLDIARGIQEDRRPNVEGYVIAKLLKKLDDSPAIADEVIARLEMPLIPALERHRPNLVFHQEVLNEPSLFADLISWGFKRSDEQTEEVVDEQVMRNRATFGYQILSGLRGLPGQLDNGDVDPERLETWVNEVRRICKERGREAIGDEKIGKVLANSPVGADGAWPCEPVRDLLEGLRSSHIGIGFIVGKFNLRGVTSRAPLDGGRKERSLAEEYRLSASAISAKWPFTAHLLRKMADGSDRDAHWFDERSQWFEEFQS